MAATDAQVDLVLGLYGLTRDDVVERAVDGQDRRVFQKVTAQTIRVDADGSMMTPAESGDADGATVFDDDAPTIASIDDATTAYKAGCPNPGESNAAIQRRLLRSIFEQTGDM